MARIVTFIILMLASVASAQTTEKLTSTKEDSSTESTAAPKLSAQKLWTLATCAVLTERNEERHDLIGGCPRTEANIKDQKGRLQKWWGVSNREELLSALQSLQAGGQRSQFAKMGAQIESLSAEKQKTLIEKIKDPELAATLQVVAEQYKRLGKKSLIGWDFARYVSVCRMGYMAGFLSEAEFWQRVMPVARKLQATFQSWDELGENYLIGRRFWSPLEPEADKTLYKEAYDLLCSSPDSPWVILPWNLDLTDGVETPPPAPPKLTVEASRKLINLLETQTARDSISALPGDSRGERATDWRWTHWWIDLSRTLPASEVLLANSPNDPEVIRLHHFILFRLKRWHEAADFGVQAIATVEKSGNLECLFWVLNTQVNTIYAARLANSDDSWGRSFKKYRCAAVADRMVALAQEMNDDNLLHIAYYYKGLWTAWASGDVEPFKKALAIAERNGWTNRSKDCMSAIAGTLAHGGKLEESAEWSRKAGLPVDDMVYVVQKDWPNVYSRYRPLIDNLEKETLRQPNERLQRELVGWNQRWAFDYTAVAAYHLDKPEEAIEIAERLHNRTIGTILTAAVENGRQTAILKVKENEVSTRKKVESLDAQLALAQKKSDAATIESIQRDLKVQSDALQGLTGYIAADELEIKAVRTPAKMTVAEMKSLLGPDDAIVMYYPTSASLFRDGLIAVISQSGATCSLHEGLYVNASDPGSLRPKVERYLKGLLSKDSSGVADDEFRAANDELYKLLVEPVRDSIKSKRHIIIIPSGPLATLPIHLLKDKTGRYLLEGHTVSYVPSVGVLKYALTRNRKIGGDVTIVANPAIEQQGAALKFAEIEAHEIQKVFPNANLLLGDRATESAVKAILSTADVIHFACHGLLDAEEPMRLALVLARDDKNDGMLTAREICDYPVRAGLVVLSSCESGAGGPSAGWIELVGMSRAWLLAGAPSVVVSLWKLDDKETSELMAYFYSNLKTMGRAEALRQAQLTMSKKYENPYLWGAFVLYGDYR